MAFVVSVVFCVVLCIFVSMAGGADGWLAGGGWAVSISVDVRSWGGRVLAL